MNDRYPERHPPEFTQRFDAGETEDTLHKLVEGFREFGDVFRIYSPTRQNYTYVVNHPDFVKRVLSTNHRNYRKGVGIDRVGVLLGKGLMVSEGELWRRQRKMVQPFFHRRAIHKFFRTMQRCTNDLVQQWQRIAATGSAVNITEHISNVTLRVVLESIFSEDLETLEHEYPFKIVSEESARDLMFAAKFRALSRPIRTLVEQRRQRKVQRNDLLQMLMEVRDKDTGRPMEDRALVDEVMTLIVAGHETTASSLNWLWYLVSQHPEVAGHLGDETAALSPDLCDDPDALLGLEYTKMVIDEALRLYPPGWLLTRRAIADDHVGEYTIPAGADVFISPYLLHRHPAHWQDPESFRPERFAEQAVMKRHAFAYIPFGAGPRRCVGDAFATAEMQLHVAMVAQHFSFQLQNDRPVEMEALVNLRSKHPFTMVLEQRN